MSATEIPLLRESRAFAVRLLAAAKRFDEPRYFFHRRVNWSYRFAYDFYARESACFVAGADAYLAGLASDEAELGDVYATRLSARQAAASTYISRGSASCIRPPY